MTSGAKASWSAIKSHWGWFAVFFFAAIVLALWYDHKNSGDLTKKVASIPVVGKLFMCFAITVGLGKLLAARLLLASIGSA